MFLFDECVDNGIFESLLNLYREQDLFIELGYKINENEYQNFHSYTKGKNDIEVLNYAFSNKLILITEDKDFGELVYRLNYPHCGIVLIRIKDLPRTERILIAASTIFEYRNELKNNFSVISNDGIKIKQHLKKTQ
jgi:predicted nuclease of predicted toxin-antitoxin system